MQIHMPKVKVIIFVMKPVKLYKIIERNIVQVKLNKKFV